MLGRQLCENPADDHWALRKYAAHLVAQICDRYGETYENIQPRVSKTYHKAITDPSCPFTTQYGALYGAYDVVSAWEAGSVAYWTLDAD